MFFLLVQLLFRINSPEKIRNIPNKKKNIKYQECLRNQNKKSLQLMDAMQKCKHLKEGEDDGDDGIYFEDLAFSSKNMASQRYAIYADDSDLFIARCNFTQCLFSDGLIYTNSLNYNFSMNSNQIIGCYNRNEDISSSTNIVFSNSKYNDIQNNIITFTDTSHACRALQIRTSTNTIFNNNEITNANVGSNHDDFGSGIYFTEEGTGNPLQFSGNKFSSCYGGNGAILRFADIDYHLQIYDTTFEWSKNNDLMNNNGEPSGYYIVVNAKSHTEDPQITFSGCTFDHLESNAKGGGAIGLWFKEDIKMIMTLTFENTHFTNLYFADENQPGGAILMYKEASNKNTHLTVRDCEFSNISWVKEGAAIYYQSQIEFSLVIERTTFTNAISTDAISTEEALNNAAIYTVFWANSAITIDDCKFTNTVKPNYEASVISLNNPRAEKGIKATINKCVFDNCLSSGVVVYSDIYELEFTNSEIQGTTAGISMSPTSKFTIQHSAFKNLHQAIYCESPSYVECDCTLSNCVFDSCSTVDGCCFDLGLQVSSFIFANNEIKGTDIKNVKPVVYLGKINCNEYIDTLEMRNITFQDNKCIATYGGGTGLMIEGVLTKLSYIDCKFIRNFAGQNTKDNRPTASGDTTKYYSGDGGAIQIGYSMTTSEIDILFDTCTFENNQAYRHGGAIAIQTLKTVDIINCVFNNNIANIKTNSPKLLYDNHFSKKSDGRGGAIYINPCYTYVNNRVTYPAEGVLMTDVKIEDCTFESNKAFDGYAIYIEGDESASTKFIITGNKFFNNINKETHTENSAVIASEITNIYDGKVPTENTFKYDDGSKVKPIIYVDHYGKAPTYHGIYGINLKQNPSWDVVEGTYHIKSTQNSEASLTFTGIGFTLYGSYNTGYGTFTVNIDGNDYQTINENAAEQSDVELCSSPELEFTTHTVTIKANANVVITKIEVNTYYNTKFIDVNAFETSGSWTQESNNQGGYRLLSQTADNTLVTTATCSQFYIYGQKGPGYGSFSVRVDTKEVAAGISAAASSKEDFALLYVSNPTQPSSVSFHTIQIVSQAGKVYIDNLIYTDHDIYLEANYTEFTHDGTWTSSDKGLSTTNEEDTLEFLYFGTAFKIFGSQGSSCASMKINLDGNDIATVSTNAEKEINHAHLYSSADNGVAINCGQHLVKITLVKGNVANAKIEVCKIIYLQPETPPTPSQSLTPGPSQSLTEQPSEEITEQPTQIITKEPTVEITEQPTQVITKEATVEITEQPTQVITKEATVEITEQPTQVITKEATVEITEQPTQVITKEATVEITEQPTQVITKEATVEITEQPTQVITKEATVEITEQPTQVITKEATVEITEQPTQVITKEPTVEITEQPTQVITKEPTVEITEQPTQVITKEATVEITEQPTQVITKEATVEITEQPTQVITKEATVEITEQPTIIPTEIPEIGDEVNSTNCNKDIRCMKVVEAGSTEAINVHVEITDFVDFKEREYGGALYLIRCGITCDKSTFTNCKARKGGGAIFIKNELSLKNTINFTNIGFNACQAAYGGALYIYSSQKAVQVRVTLCTFNLNKIVPDQSETETELNGGTSIYMTAKNGKISSCIFNDENQEGYGSLKLYNNFNLIPDSTADLKILENVGVSVTDCKFNIKGKAKNAILYVRGLSDVEFEVNNCVFKGPLSDNSHYIEEKVLVKKSPKLQIKLCKFDDNSKKSILLDATNDIDMAKSQNKFSVEKISKNNNQTFKVFQIIFLPTLALIALISVFTILLIKMNNANVVENSDKVNEIIEL